MTKLCAFCRTPLTKSNRTKEHIIPNAIGGRKKVINFICRSCNSKTGEKWDAELINQLRPFCTMLDISRARGHNQPFPVETVSGRTLTWNPDGSLTIRRPVFEQRSVDDKKYVTMQARSMTEFRIMLSDLKRTHPELDVEKLMSQASASQEYLQEPIQMSHTFAGTLAGRSIIKSCLALAHEAGLSIDDCENAKSYLLSNGEACFGYYNESDPVVNRPANTLLHCVYVCADPESGLVLAYIEYFGFQKIVACLSNKYRGPRLECSYAVNPITGQEQGIDVALNITSAEISDIYNYEKMDYERAKSDIENALRVWKEIDNSRAVERAVNDAIDFTCLQMGIRDGDVLSEEEIARFSDCVFEKLAPTLLRLKFGQSFTDEEIRAIIGNVNRSSDKKNYDQ